eukprot:TRINITY_DN3864_c0_g1_i1.p1 TRINITY_DN3864_c0_g1~~TRINITY_DN3864_c0_g1_i1.p1  ORF type:complete len:1337 (+),score=349.06 TRINITY_DN3864_c0_g1_i1:53-4063(+)
MEVSKLVRACADGNDKLVEVLLKGGANISREPGTALAPLFAAACEGHANCVRMLLQQKASDAGGDLNIDDGDSLGRSPLYAACVNGHVQCAMLLVSAGANIAVGGGPDGGSALHAAVRADATKIVALLLQVVGDKLGALLELRDREDRTALHLAVENQSFDSAELLLQRGAQPEVVDTQGQTPLHVACRQGMEDFVDLLLEHRASTNARDANGRTPLHLAACAGRVECVELLLRPANNTEMDPVDNNGMTPFHLACLNNQTSTLRILHKKGANFKTTDVNGRGVIHTAAANGCVSAAQFVRDACSVSVTAVDNNMRTPLHIAAVANQPKMVAWLLSAGASPTTKDKPHCRTPFHWAARLGFDTVIKALAEKIAPGGDIGVDAQLRSPLHLAALAGSVPCVEALCPLVDRNLRDRRGCTALFYAAAKDFHEVVEVLLAAGADPTISSDQGHLPIHIAAHKGHYECVALLAGAGRYPSESVLDAQRRTPLHFAAMGGYVDCIEELVQKKVCDVDTADAEGRTALHFAAFSGNHEAVEWLADAGAVVDARDSVGETPLFKAAFTGSFNCMQILIDHKADAKICDNKNHSTLHASAFSGDVECVELIKSTLDNSWLRVVDNEGRTPFHYAVCSLETDVAELLLEGEDDEQCEQWANQPCKNRQTPLHIAAHLGDIDMSSFLLSYAADPCAQDENGVTPLMTAVSKGKKPCTEMLLEKSSKCVNLIDANRRSALHWAAFYGHAECVSLLLKYNVEPDTPDKFQQTPIMLASFAGHTQVVQALLALSPPVDLARHSQTGSTALHYACMGGHAPIVHALVNAKAKVDDVDQQRRTPMHCAAHNGHPHLVGMLLGAGADVNTRDRFRLTPLAYAAINGDALMVKRLLDEKADPSFSDLSGVTPAQWARNKVHVHCAELLEGKTTHFTFSRRARALFDFNARDGTEINIRVGDLVNVLWEHESGWWKGELSDRVGLFPSNYCEIVDETPPATPPATPPEKAPEMAAAAAAPAAAPSEIVQFLSEAASTGGDGEAATSAKETEPKAEQAQQAPKEAPTTTLPTAAGAGKTEPAPTAQQAPPAVPAAPTSTPKKKKIKATPKKPKSATTTSTEPKCRIPRPSKSPAAKKEPKIVPVATSVVTPAAPPRTRHVGTSSLTRRTATPAPFAKTKTTSRIPAGEQRASNLRSRLSVAEPTTPADTTHKPRTPSPTPSRSPSTSPSPSPTPRRRGEAAAPAVVRATPQWCQRLYDDADAKRRAMAAACEERAREREKAELAECTYTPRLCRRSEEMASTKQSGFASVFDRLYAQRPPTPTRLSLTGERPQSPNRPKTPPKPSSSTVARTCTL